MRKKCHFIGKSYSQLVALGTKKAAFAAFLSMIEL
jgi:hypothetical protein